MPYPNLSTKTGDRVEDGGEGFKGKVMVNTKRYKIPTPCMIKTITFIGSYYHTSIGNGVISKTKVTSVISFGFTTKIS